MIAQHVQESGSEGMAAGLFPMTLRGMGLADLSSSDI